MTRTPEWHLAQDVLGEVLMAAYASARIQIGRVRCLGEGLSRRVFVADVLVDPDAGRSGPYVVALPHPEAVAGQGERSRREVALLEVLTRMDLPFRVPEVIGVRAVSQGLAVVQRYLCGSGVDMRVSKTPGGKPWEMIGQAAAAIHATVLPDGAADLPRHSSWRAHALAELAACDVLSDRREVRQALDWVRTHLPPDEPPVLLHGDLLGQNILWHAKLSPAVIDWEQAQWGDPAYDLAIVTRSVRRPFQVNNGLALLLEAYHQAGGPSLVPADIHRYELCTQLQRYAAALAGKGSHPSETILRQLNAVLYRASRSVGP